MRGTRAICRPSVEQICPRCGKTFPAWPSEVARGTHKYCSRPCYIAAKTRPINERFWSKVDQSGGPDACWPWTAGTVNGYGRVRWQGKLWRAHRVAWELTNGPIPEGALVRHLVCDNPPCCNPAHLAVGTDADNTADMFAKGRGEPVTCQRGESHWTNRAPDRLASIRGENNGHAKLTDDQVAEIRRRHAAGGITQAALAREFGVCQPHISDLIRGYRRQH